MKDIKRKLFMIKLAYWLGICADAFWAIIFLFPSLLYSVTGNPDSDPQTRSIYVIAGILMTGWTLLLIWAIRKPIERRGVILLTAFPVVFGIAIITLKNFLRGDTSNMWILIKTVILFVTMVNSYYLANKMDKEMDIL